MSPISLAFVIVAAILAAVVLVQSRAVNLLAWGLLALAGALLIAGL